MFQILGLKSNHAQQNCKKLGRGGDVSTLAAHGELLRCWLDVGSGCAPSEVSPLQARDSTSSQRRNLRAAFLDAIASTSSE